MDSGDRNFHPQVTIEAQDDYSPTNIPRYNRFCCNFPCFGSLPANARLTAAGPTSSSQTSDERWWDPPVRAFKKIREWSEIVAGPKWKTFIRRFNRNNRNRQTGKFQYDPLSYALNFDEGQNGQLEEDCEGQYPDFSSRLAGTSLSGKSSMDLGK